MDDALAQAVRRRAGFACEYCKLPAQIHRIPFEIEHIIPKQHRGRTALSNLAYSCLHCNRCKGTNLTGIEWHGSRMKLVPIFNPRRQKWKTHFRWSGSVLVGLTPVGRVTIDVLVINDPLRVALRSALMEEGVFKT
jgi:hypothetical protein